MGWLLEGKSGSGLRSVVGLVKRWRLAVAVLVVPKWRRWEMSFESEGGFIRRRAATASFRGIVFVMAVNLKRADWLHVAEGLGELWGAIKSAGQIRRHPFREGSFRMGSVLFYGRRFETEQSLPAPGGALGQRALPPCRP